MSMLPEPQELLEERQKIVSGFLRQFVSNGYEEVEHEPLKPLTDKSVYFVGASINRFKEYMARGYAPASGQVVLQPCLRLFSINTILEENQKPHFCFFKMLGTYREVEYLKNVCLDLGEFLTETLKLPRNRIRAISHVHDRLIFENIAGPLNVEFCDENESDYRWKFGLQGIHGRGLLVEIQSERGEWREIGQVIHLSKDNKPFACELAFGVEMLQWALRGGNDFRKFWTIQGVAESLKACNDWRYLDSISTIAAMYYADTVPDQSKHGVFLKKGLRNLTFISREHNIEFYETVSVLEAFSEIEFGNVSFLKQFEEDFRSSIDNVDHNLLRFSGLVENLSIKVKNNELELGKAHQKALATADGACFVPEPIRDGILLRHGLVPLEVMRQPTLGLNPVGLQPS